MCVLTLSVCRGQLAARVLQQHWRTSRQWHPCFLSEGMHPSENRYKSLPREEQTFIGKRILAVQYRWPVGMPLVRKLEEDLWEVRVTRDNRTARILFTIQEDTLMLLLHGFIKKSRKTPQEDLDLARRRLRELRNRKA